MSLITISACCAAQTQAPIEDQDKVELFSCGEKAGIITDIIIGALAALFAVGIILTSNGMVDLGPLNAISSFGPDVARIILGVTGGVLSVDIIILMVKMNNHINHLIEANHQLAADVDGQHNRALRQEVEQLRLIGPENEARGHTIIALQGEKQQIETDRDALILENRELKSKLQIQVELDQLQGELDQRLGKIDAGKKEEQRLTKLIEKDLPTQIRELQATKTALEQELNLNRETKVHQDAALLEVERQITEAKANLQQAQKEWETLTVTTLPQLKAQVEPLQEQKLALEAELPKMREEKLKLERDLEDANTRLGNIQLEVNELKLGDLKEQAQQLKKELDALEAAKKAAAEKPKKEEPKSQEPTNPRRGRSIKKDHDGVLQPATQGKPNAAEKTGKGLNQPEKPVAKDTKPAEEPQPAPKGNQNPEKPQEPEKKSGDTIVDLD